MYRIKKGESILLVDEDGTTKETYMERTVDFDKNKLIASPLDEHNKEGIPFSINYLAN